MVDRNDTDSSESSQPPTPTRTLSEYKPHFMTSDTSLPRPELELSISLNDRHRSVSAKGKSVNDEFDLTLASIPPEDTLGRPGGVEEESSFSGPARKRARMSIPFTSLQERDVPSKEPVFYPHLLSRMEAPQPVFYPDLLSRMEAAQQVRGGEICMLATALARPSGTPPLTVVLAGRSIGRRISLQDYDGYDNFAAAMKTMFHSHILRIDVSSQEPPPDGGNYTLMSAIPGYVIAYQDEEGDVRLAGKIPWRDFVRMAKQIRIVPVIDLR